jgi:amidophosphoribosyltransferase
VFGTIGAKRIRDVQPGEIIKIQKGGVKTFHSAPHNKAFCIFEFIYFSRPDSIINGQSVYTVRENLGKLLAKTCPKGIDMVIGVPDSGIPAAIGFSVASGVPYREGLIKNRYIGRTFINPDQIERLKTIKLKLNALRSVISGKSIILVDDSIVRGNTMQKIVRLLKEKGAKEVHVRISCPPIMHPCFFGVDFPSYSELVANSNPIEKIKEIIGADSLEYISLGDLVKATGLPKDEFCLACFNGAYPYDLGKDENSKLILEKAN